MRAMVSMPNPLIPPLVPAAAAVGGGIALAFLRTRSRAAALVALDTLILALALAPVELLAHTLALLSPAPKETLWLASLAAVALPLAYLPPRIAWMAHRRILPALLLGALLAFTRILGELIVAVAALDRLTILTGAMLVFCLASGWLAARALPSR